MYDDFDYLCDEPYYIDGIGTIKNPTLRDIRKITHEMFTLYVNLCSISIDEYQKIYGLSDQCNNLSNKEKSNNTIYNIMLFRDTKILFGLIDFFVVNYWEFSEKDMLFHVYIDKTKKQEIGFIGNDNFNIFRNEILKVLGLKKIDEKPPKYKSERARLLAEKIAKAKSLMKNNAKKDDNISLDNMIKKYCTYNKVGINIMNVWNMTFNQFNSMFSEYCVSRQIDFSDMMAANTFSYKDQKDYKPELWIEKLNKGN